MLGVNYFRLNYKLRSQFEAAVLYINLAATLPELTLLFGNHLTKAVFPVLTQTVVTGAKKLNAISVPFIAELGNEIRALAIVAELAVSKNSV